MQFSLARMSARKRKSRRPVTFSPIITTKAQASDLNRIYAQMLEPWSRAVAIIGPLYEAELERVLQHDSPEDLGATNDSIAAAINRLILELTPELRRWALRVEDWHQGKWARAVLNGVDIALDTLLGPEDVRETLDAWLVRNVSLVRDVNEQARGKIADAVLRGFQQRSPVSEVMKEVRAATGFATKRARRIAADQTVKLASALDRERQRQAGLDHWKWRHSGKLHPRLKHVERDGKLYTDKTAPEDEPGELPFCGCVRQGVLVFEGEEL